MLDWDTTLKQLITESGDRVLPMLGAASGIKRWLNVELPTTQNLRVDLLAELMSGELGHIELQSKNLPGMPFRMLEYSVAIYRSQGRFPQQILLYVGNDTLHVDNTLRVPGIDFRFEVIDLRTLDGTALLESEKLSENLLALMMAVEDRREAIRRIVVRINRLDEVRRRDALARLLLTCGMRKLLTVAHEEIEKMPATGNILDDPFLAKIALEREEKGREQGREQGRDRGRREIVHDLIEKKFGPLPAWVDERMSSASSQQIDALAMRILDCPTLDQLFSPQ